MQVGSRYVAAAVKRAAPQSQTKMMRLIAPKMWITVTTIATDQSVITIMATTCTCLAWRSYCSTTRTVELCARRSAPGRAHRAPWSLSYRHATRWVSSVVSAGSGWALYCFRLKVPVGCDERPIGCFYEYSGVQKLTHFHSSGAS